MLESIDHAASRRSVEADCCRQRRLIDARLLGDGIERGKLHRRQVEANCLCTCLEYLCRLLVQSPDQVPRHLNALHRCFRVQRGVPAVDSLHILT
jgi:hypothetical protein